MKPSRSDSALPAHTRGAALLVASSALFALLSTGCSSFVPFSYELRSGHHLADDEVKDLQFYSSHEITLRREVQSEDRQITPGHKLRLVSGRSVEEVVIPAKTPGVATRVSAQAISVSFVNGTSLDFVVRGDRFPRELAGGFAQPFVVGEGAFGAQKGGAASFLGQTYAQPPNPFPREVKVVGNEGRQPAPVGDLAGNYYLAVASSGYVPFVGLSWEAIGETPSAHLLIDSDKLEETEEKRTVLPGVRLDR